MEMYDTKPDPDPGPGQNHYIKIGSKWYMLGFKISIQGKSSFKFG